MSGRQLDGPAQQGLGVRELLVLAPVELREHAQGVDVVRVLAQRRAQRLDGLVLAARPQVIERQRDLAAGRVTVEEFLEGLVGLAAAAERRKRLAELLVRFGSCGSSRMACSKLGTASSYRP